MNPDAPEPAPVPAPPSPRGWRTATMALAGSAVVFAIYMANGREIWSGDTVPAKYLTCALIRGDGFYLEDMIAVTANGFEVLTPGLPYTAREIEAVMANGATRRDR